MLQTFLDLLFPRHSLTQNSGEFVTQEELRQLRSSPVILPASRLREMGLVSLDCVVAAGEYDKLSLLKKAIHTWKYRRVPGVGEKLTALLPSALPLLDSWHRSSKLPSSSASMDSGWAGTMACVVCPVPLHWTREFWRGFNQAETLAHLVATETGLPMRHLLRRVRPTGHQARRKRDERFMAVRDAFACVTDHRPERVILVDDLCTTGATLDACAKVLKERGTRRVEAIVLALG